MKKSRLGFTLIEVALFLAVTGMLFVGIAVGVQNSIYQQRYNDSVQNYVEFLRSVYSQVMNVQSLGEGRTEQAIYGKLVTFGESVDLSGCPVNGNTEVVAGCDEDNRNKNMIFTYDVVGWIGVDDSGLNVLDALDKANANVIDVESNELEGTGSVEPVGIIESYVPKWTAQIQNTSENYELFKGALLIARHPRSGTVYTYVLDGETIEVNKFIDKQTTDFQEVKGQITEATETINNKNDEIAGYNDQIATIQGELSDSELSEEQQSEIERLEGLINEANMAIDVANGKKTVAESERANIIRGMKENALRDALRGGKFEMKAVDFCVNPNGDEKGGLRRDVRIIAKARNSSGVELLSDEDSQCKRGD
ncbi:hypothetical protein IKG33_01320 [Candidatus Saccharibacteria bacterium]|nr:hypothetical protein [Candidatus Saccharibacteria bacterium]